MFEYTYLDNEKSSNAAVQYSNTADLLALQTDKPTPISNFMMIKGAANAVLYYVSMLSFNFFFFFTVIGFYKSLAPSVAYSIYQNTVYPHRYMCVWHWSKMFFMKEHVNINLYFSNSFSSNTQKKNSYAGILLKFALKRKNIFA